MLKQKNTWLVSMKFGVEHIDLFLQGKLNANEEEQFKLQLETDEELLDALTEKTIASYGQLKLKNKLKQIDGDLKSNKLNLLKILRLGR